MMNDLVSVLFDRWRSLAPNDQTVDAPAFTWWPVDTQGHQGLSYAELKREILRGAQVIDGLGLERGDVIGLQVPRSPRWLPLFLGALSRGVVALLLNDAYTPRELNFAISDAGARVALVPRGKLDELTRLQAQREGGAPAVLIAAGELSRLFEETHSAEVSASDRSSFSGDALAVLAYTSGTTGQPKGARIRHRDLIGTLEALHEAWAWSPEDRLVHTLPLFHIHGLFVAALGALWARAHIIALDRFDALGALRAVEHHRATVLMGVPTHHHRYLQLPASDRPNVSSLRLVTSGSAPLSAERFEAFREAFGVEIVERYGMTEVGIVLSERLDRARRPGSVGFPLPGVSAKICDPEGAELGAGEVGEVHISSRSLFEGYHQLPEATAASVYDRDGARWMRTGDIGMRDEDGRYWLRGRASEMIISGGLNVYPREVERALLEVASTLALTPELSGGSGISEVSEVLALGVPDPEWGERVEAYLTTRDGRPLHRSALEAISQELREVLAPYKCPKKLHWITSLPRNAMGKAQRHRLRPRWREGGCHCRAVRWRAYLPERFDAELCNCSICAMSGNVHVIISKDDFELTQGAEHLSAYRFNTRAAEHLFCARCGVKSFYHPRSHPEGVGVTWRCLDDWLKLEVAEVPFNGQEWEAEIESLSHRVVSTNR